MNTSIHLSCLKIADFLWLQSVFRQAAGEKWRSSLCSLDPLVEHLKCQMDPTKSKAAALRLAMPRKRKRVIRNRVQWIANFPRADLRALFLCCFFACFFAAPGGSLGEIAPPVVVWDNVSAHALGMPRVRFQTAGGSFYVQLR